MRWNLQPCSGRRQKRLRFLDSACFLRVSNFQCLLLLRTAFCRWKICVLEVRFLQFCFSKIWIQNRWIRMHRNRNAWIRRRRIPQFQIFQRWDLQPCSRRHQKYLNFLHSARFLRVSNFQCLLLPKSVFYRWKICVLEIRFLQLCFPKIWIQNRWIRMLRNRNAWIHRRRIPQFQIFQRWNLQPCSRRHQKCLNFLDSACFLRVSNLQSLLFPRFDFYRWMIRVLEIRFL